MELKGLNDPVVLELRWTVIKIKLIFIVREMQNTCTISFLSLKIILKTKLLKLSFCMCYSFDLHHNMYTEFVNFWLKTCTGPVVNPTGAVLGPHQGSIPTLRRQPTVKYCACLSNPVSFPCKRHCKHGLHIRTRQRNRWVCRSGLSSCRFVSWNCVLLFRRKKVTKRKKHSRVSKKK